MPSRPWESLGLRSRDPQGPGGHYFFSNNALAGILIIIDPNPAIAAHAVFPQSSHSRPEKRPFFYNFPFFQEGTQKKVFTAYRSPMYQVKGHTMLFRIQNKSFHFDKRLGLVKAFNLNICSKVSGNFEGI